MLKIKIKPSLGRDVLENAVNDYDVAEETINGQESIVIRNPRYLRNVTELTAAEVAAEGQAFEPMARVRELDLDSPLYHDGWREATFAIWMEALNPYMSPANGQAGKGTGPRGLLSQHTLSGKKVYVSDAKLRMWSMRQYSVAYSGKFEGAKGGGYDGSSNHGRITFLTNGAGVALEKVLSYDLQPKLKAAWSIKGHSVGEYNALTASAGTEAYFPLNLRIPSILGYYNDTSYDGWDYSRCVPFLVTPKDVNKYNPMESSLFARKHDRNPMECTRDNKAFNDQWSDGSLESKRTITFYDKNVGFYGQDAACGGEDRGLAAFKGRDRKTDSGIAGPVYVMTKVHTATDHPDTADITKLLVHSATRRYAEHMLAPIVTQMAVARLRRFTSPSFMGETEETKFGVYTGIVCLWGTSGAGSTDRPTMYCEETFPEEETSNTEYHLYSLSACTRTVYTKVSGQMWANRSFQLVNQPAVHWTLQNDSTALNAQVEGRGGAILGSSESLSSLDSETYIPMCAKDLVSWGVAGSPAYELGRLCINENGAAVYCPDLEDKFRHYVFPAATLSILGVATQGSSNPCIRAVETVGFDSAERDMDEWFGDKTFSYGQLNFKILARGKMYA